MEYLIFALPVLLVAAVYVRCLLAVTFAIQNGEQEHPLFGGLARLILWEPNEGLVLLKNKAVWQIIEDGAGGTRFISPLFGEEVGARVSLREQMLTWEDENILTRESLQVRLKVAVWWRATDLRRYALAIGTQIPSKRPSPEALLEATSGWLVTLTESSLRTLASTMSIASLVSSNASSYLLETQVMVQSDDDLADEPGSFTENLRHVIQQQLDEYGIRIVRVAIQEVSLSEAIGHFIEEAWATRLEPGKKQQLALAQKAWMETLTEVLGDEALATRFVFEGVKGGMPWMMPPLSPDAFLPSRIPDQLTAEQPEGLAQEQPHSEIGAGDGQADEATEAPS